MEDPRIISALFIFLKMAYYNVLINTQMIYALTVAGCSLIGYLIIGITNGNLLLSLGTSIFILCIFTFIMHRRSKTILNKKDICSTQ